MTTLEDILKSIPELKSLSEKQKEEYAEELSSLIRKASDLMILRKENEKLFSLEKTLSEDVEGLKNRLFPSIYFGIAKHHSTKVPYIIARSMWKKGYKDYAQLSAYIGPVANFKDGVDDEEVKEIALEKIRKKIRDKFPSE